MLRSYYVPTIRIAKNTQQVLRKLQGELQKKDSTINVTPDLVIWYLLRRTKKRR